MPMPSEEPIVPSRGSIRRLGAILALCPVVPFLSILLLGAGGWKALLLGALAWLGVATILDRAVRKILRELGAEIAESHAYLASPLRTIQIVLTLLLLSPVLGPCALLLLVFFTWQRSETLAGAGSETRPAAFGWMRAAPRILYAWLGLMVSVPYALICLPLVGALVEGAVTRTTDPQLVNSAVPLAVRVWLDLGLILGLPALAAGLSLALRAARALEERRLRLRLRLRAQPQVSLGQEPQLEWLMPIIRIASASLSVFCPGCGHLLRGQLLRAPLWCLAVVLGYVPLVVPGLILHVLCVIDAAGGLRRR